MPRYDTDVLIVGAGPTGLVLALYLQRLGVRFQIIDKAAAAGQTSRALILHARTLEYYRQLSLDEAVLEAVQQVRAVNLWVNGRRRGRLNFGDMGGALSKYPFMFIFPQDEHESVLIKALHQRGVDVERNAELADLTVDRDAVFATLRAASGETRRCSARFVAGCDGAHSVVRERLDIALPGGTYDHLWYVADVVAAGPLANQEINISMSTRDALAVMPMKGQGGARLVGQAPPGADNSSVTWDSVGERLMDELDTDVKTVRWFSTYHVHHRVAHDFRKGRGFLLGDAAHLHSPVGGQGMNTGIGDAANLAWKLAEATKNDREELLDTYEPERMAFARRLVATTDLVFGLLNGKSAFAQLFRTVLAPTFMPPLFRTASGRRAAFRILSQISINYRMSTLSKGSAGTVRGGDRLPWVRAENDSDNYTPLDAIVWQVHVYGTAHPHISEFCNARGLPLYMFPWTSTARDAGIERDSVFVVRPDGYVGLAANASDPHLIEDYLAEHLAIAASQRSGEHAL